MIASCSGNSGVLRRAWHNARSSLRHCAIVLTLPGSRTIAISTFLARLAKGMVPLAIVYHVYGTTGSYALAGSVAAALAAGDALTTPVLGWLVDRFGRPPVLICAAVVYVIALVALVVVGTTGDGSAWSLVACGFVAGAGFPPVSGAVKAVWARIAPDDRALSAAYTLESLIQQIVFLSGPLLVVAAMAFVPAGYVLLIAAGCTGVGTVVFAWVARSIADAPGPVGTGQASALRVRQVRTLIAATVAQGLFFGAMPIILPMMAVAAGIGWAGGPLQTALSVGGLVGTFGLAVVTGNLPRVSRHHASLLARFAIALVPLGLLGLAPSPATVVVAGVVLSCAGLLLTPIAATSYLIVEKAAGASQRTEAFAWLSTALACGTAAGSSIAGMSADRLGIVATMFLPAAGMVLAAVAARALLSQARPAGVPAESSAAP